MKIRRKTEEIIEKMREQIEEQRKILDFLSNHDKNDVIIDLDCTYGGVYYGANFLYQGEIKEKKLAYTDVYTRLCIEVVENNPKSFVVCLKKQNDLNHCECEYVKIDKATCAAVDVSEFFKKDEEKAEEGNADGTDSTEN